MKHPLRDNPTLRVIAGKERQIKPMESPDQRRSDLGLRPLPDVTMALLERLKAPPRLVAHLILVHDVAMRLTGMLQAQWPDLALDAEAVQLGASWHDIGKIMYPEELSTTGHRHEVAGLNMLLEAGIDMRLARFAQTHGTWSSQADITFEDLLVALADTCWKGKRDHEWLERRIADHLIEVISAPQWEVFLTFDQIVEDLEADANARLIWQNRFPLTA